MGRISLFCVKKFFWEMMIKRSLLTHPLSLSFSVWYYLTLTYLLLLHLSRLLKKLTFLLRYYIRSSISRTVCCDSTYEEICSSFSPTYYIYQYCFSRKSLCFQVSSLTGRHSGTSVETGARINWTDINDKMNLWKEIRTLSR